MRMVCVVTCLCSVHVRHYIFMGGKERGWGKEFCVCNTLPGLNFFPKGMSEFANGFFVFVLFFNI